MVWQRTAGRREQFAKARLLPDTDNAPQPLSELNRHYPNLYRRRALDSPLTPLGNRVGFHTNRQTKALVTGHLISLVRDSATSSETLRPCNELAVYERDPSGRYTARHGCHDDILMTRAIGLWVASQMPLRPTCLTSLFIDQSAYAECAFSFPANNIGRLHPVPPTIPSPRLSIYESFFSIPAFFAHFTSRCVP